MTSWRRNEIGDGYSHAWNGDELKQTEVKSRAEAELTRVAN